MTERIAVTVQIRLVKYRVKVPLR